jgi:gliding motility-associated lipoprotein GldD
MITICLERVTALLVWALVITMISSCNSTYTPRPRGYFKIDFPAHTYQSFDTPGYPYRFEYPAYASIVQDSTFFEEQPENPYWLNIDFPQFHGKIYISYIEIGGKSRYKIRDAKGNYIDSVGINTFDNLIKSSYALTYKHTYKASSIDDSAFTTAHHVEGIYFKIGGNAATANQFLVTDSVKHFLRGALYFDATPNADSLGIVNHFLQQDMKHLINSLAWR